MTTLLIIYILSALMTFILFTYDTIRVLGELTFNEFLKVLCLGSIPIVNTILILWFLWDCYGMKHVIIYRKKRE